MKNTLEFWRWLKGRDFFLEWLAYKRVPARRTELIQWIEDGNSAYDSDGEHLTIKKEEGKKPRLVVYRRNGGLYIIETEDRDIAFSLKEEGKYSKHSQELTMQMKKKYGERWGTPYYVKK